jgi:hypothetical protein
MKNKLVKISIVVAVALLGLFAYKKINAAELHGDFSAAYNSELQFRGVSADQSSILTSFGADLSIAGFEVGVVGAVNTKDGPDEVRLGASTSLELVDGVTTSVGVVNYTDNHVLGNGTEFYVELGAEVILDTSVKVYYNPDESITTVEGSVGKQFEVWEDYGLGVSATLGNTEYLDERTTYYGGDALLTKSVNEETQLFLGVSLRDLHDVQNADQIVSVFGGIQHNF